MNLEGAAVARLCVNVNETMWHDGAVNDGKRKACSLSLLFRRKEWVEDMLPNVVIHSRTGICNRDADIITIFSSGMLVPQLTSGECLIGGFLYRPFRPSH